MRMEISELPDYEESKNYVCISATEIIVFLSKFNKNKFYFSTQNINDILQPQRIHKHLQQFSLVISIYKKYTDIIII